MNIQNYIQSHSTPPSDALAWIERQTHLRTNHARMLSGAVQGQFLSMLTQMINPRRVLELGTFTGYSSVCIARALSDGAHLDTLEINDEMQDLILEGFRRAGVADKVSLHIGDAKQKLQELLQGISADNADILYDMVYIDANKREYCEYYSLVFDLVRPGGWILADNVLWDGKVLEEPLPQDRQTLGIARFNDLIAADRRVEVVMLPLRDGLSLIRKK